MCTRWGATGKVRDATFRTRPSTACLLSVLQCGETLPGRCSFGALGSIIAKNWHACPPRGCRRSLTVINTVGPGSVTFGSGKEGAERVLRINLILLIAFALSMAVISLVVTSTLQENATREVLAQAGLMLDSARRSAPTRDRDRPAARGQDAGLPAAGHPVLCGDAELHQAAQAAPGLHLQGIDAEPDQSARPRHGLGGGHHRSVPQPPEFHPDRGRARHADGPIALSGAPIRAEPECLSCHGLATAAPATLIARYGHDNGFGWQANEVIGAQIVSVPFSDATGGAQHLFSGVTTVIVAVLVALLAIVNAALYWMVIRPLRQMTRHADEVSLGQSAGTTFTGGSDEIGALGEAFERMRKSLDKAMKLIGSPGRGA